MSRGRRHPMGRAQGRHGLSRRALLTGAVSAWAGGHGSIAGSPHKPVATELLATSLPGRRGTVERFASRTPRWFALEGPGIISSFESDRDVVLTFDACGGRDLELDAELIDVLRRHDVPATLFVSRPWALANWRTLSDLVADPLFEIANHGDRHVPLSVSGAQAYGIAGTASVDEVFDEVSRPHRLLRTLWGIEPRWFRPGTAHADDVAAEIAAWLGTPVVGFSVNADHGATASPEVVTQSLLALQPGGIALGHMNQPGSGTAAGVHAAIGQLRDRGLRFRRLADVL